VPIWVFCVVVGSLLPGRIKVAIGITAVDQIQARSETVGAIHRSVHFGVFGATAVLFLLVAPDRRREPVAAAAAFALGALIEVAQYLLFGGVMEWWDVRDDGLGVLVASTLVHATRFREVLVRKS
jgi:uncharacterized membrane protein YgdD (TMEM256/DUF423 family)